MGKLVSFDKLDSTNTPSEIVLDTNFILNHTNKFTHHPTKQNITDCLDFAKSLVYANCEIFVPDIVINEFCCQIYSTILRDYRIKNQLKDNIIEIHKRNPSIIKSGHEPIRNAIKNLDIIRSDRKIAEGGKEVRDKALQLMGKYHLLPSDAYIGAIAMINKINNIATLDVPFTKSMLKENLNIYTPFNLINLSS